MRFGRAGRDRNLGVAAAVLLALAVLWLGGFAWFVHATGGAAPPPTQADGIVVLTGGAGRIPAALRLLRQGRAAKLLISGVGGDVGLAQLAHGSGIDPAPLAANITLGREAASTAGNAEETAAWVATNHINSLILVTAAYHMPRALIELGRALPGVRLLPAPVWPPALLAGGFGRLRLMASEYNKFLAAKLGLTRLESGVRG